MISIWSQLFRADHRKASFNFKTENVLSLIFVYFEKSTSATTSSRLCFLCRVLRVNNVSTLSIVNGVPSDSAKTIDRKEAAYICLKWNRIINIILNGRIAHCMDLFFPSWLLAVRRKKIFCGRTQKTLIFKVDCNFYERSYLSGNWRAYFPDDKDSNNRIAKKTFG